MKDQFARGAIGNAPQLPGRRHILGGALIAAVALGTAACGKAGSTAGPSAAASGAAGAGPFSIAVSDTKTAIDLPLYAGIDSGAFKDAGLDVSISAAAKSPSEGMPLLLNGTLGLLIVELHSALL